MARNKTSLDITIHDVAQEARVSLATVSRVINNKGYISPETRERVLQVVAQLGYTVNPHARSLAGGQSRIIGLVARALGSPFTSNIMRGVDAEIELAGYDMLLYSIHNRRTKETPFVATITRGLADGLLLLLPWEPHAYVATLKQRQFPFVLIDHPEPFGSVSAANRQGAYDATAYLIQLGHRRIGCVAGIHGMNSTEERLAGYRAALAHYGLPERPEYIDEGKYVYTEGYMCGKRLLDLPEPPTAIFTANDESALGVIDAVREHGLSIPDDVSIIGFDDSVAASITSPALTTVRQPMEEMGRVATQMLLRLINQPDQPLESVVLPTELVIRNTCRRLIPA